jgi:hypothetical protein
VIKGDHPYTHDQKEKPSYKRDPTSGSDSEIQTSDQNDKRRQKSSDAISPIAVRFVRLSWTFHRAYSPSLLLIEQMNRLYVYVTAYFPVTHIYARRRASAGIRCRVNLASRLHAETEQ